MMSSRYPILDNRPIDQWKVTELKEELKRRKLTTKGLKDDLIKRLDEAIRIEREAAQKDEANGFDPDPHPVVGVEDSEAVTVAAEIVNKNERESPLTVETATKGDTGIFEPIEVDNAGKIPEVLGNNKNDKLDGVTAPIDIDNSVLALDLGEVSHKDLPASIDSARVGEEITDGSIVDTNITVTESVITVVVSGQDSHSIGTQKENGNSATKQENEESGAWLENEESKPRLDQDIDLSCKDAVPDSSAPVNQVSEVNPNLGSQVKSDSISSDSVSINEKIELKDNILADNVKLEQDIVRPEMVEPSSSNYVPAFYESHSMNGGELHEKKSSIEQNRNDVTSPDLNKTNSNEDGGYPEKLNLDRSSGDDSMEEDLPESKQFNSKFNADEPREKRESSEVPFVKDDSITKVLGDGLSAGNSDTHDGTGIHPAEKRKFHDQASVGNNEPAKRQRRWNSETVKVTDPQSSNLPPAATHKDEPVALKHNFSRSDSSVTDDAPKEHTVPPPQRSPTNSLRIDRFLRPFTLKAVQELLGKTGNVTNFWMDHIKTHCYVTYSSVEEAIGTRNALYNLQWPPNGGRLLVAEFVDPQEVKMKLEPPPIQAACVSGGPALPPAPPTSQPEPSPPENRELPPVPVTLPPPPPLSKAPPAAREWLPLPPPDPEKVDLPIVTLDDLFRKTSATPRIYYLPLSEEQVAAKLAVHGKSSIQ